MRYQNANSRLAGFSLVEVMVALIVISVGLLGVAKIQALALSNTSSARLRSLAAIQAASLASSMHADRAYWANVAGPMTVSASLSGSNATDAALDTAIAAATTAGASGYCLQGGPGAPCTPVNLAAADFQVWVGDLLALIPNAQAVVDCQNTTPMTCLIKLNWKENLISPDQSAAARTALTNATFTTSNYVLYVQP